MQCSQDGDEKDLAKRVRSRCRKYKEDKGGCDHGSKGTMVSGHSWQSGGGPVCLMRLMEYAMQAVMSQGSSSSAQGSSSSVQRFVFKYTRFVFKCTRFVFKYTRFIFKCTKVRLQVYNVHDVSDCCNGRDKVVRDCTRRKSCSGFDKS